MSTTVIPPGGSVVVTEERHETSRHPDRWDLANQADKYGAATALAEATNSAAALVDSAKNFGAVTVQAEVIGNGLSTQATNNFNLASVQAVTFQNSSDISRQKFAYEGQLQAQTIAAAAAAKAAECCCELKTAIIFDGQKTRDLISAVQMQDLRDSRTKLEIAYAASFTAKVVPSTPVV